MFKNFVLFVFALLFIIKCSFVSSTETKPGADKVDTKPIVDKAESDNKSSASPQELENARTHGVLIDNLVRTLTEQLQHSNAYAPSATYPASVGPIRFPERHTFPSYGPWYIPSASYVPRVPVAVSSVHTPIASVAAPVHSSFYTPIASAVAPVSSSVYTPIASVAAPVASAIPTVTSIAAPATVPQTTITRPAISVSQQNGQQPVYSISQQVFHQPVYTEVLEVVRRPVISEVQEIIHKPVLTELQHTIKKPLYIQHIVKAPSYHSVKQEVYQTPLHLNPQAVHVVEKPSIQVVQLPQQTIKPVVSHPVQTPVYQQPAVPVVATVPSVAAVRPGVSFGSVPSYGFPYYGLGSGYGSGSIYGSSYLPYEYGQPGISLPIAQDEYLFLDQTSCRSKGDCPKRATESKVMMFQNNNLDSSAQSMPFTQNENMRYEMPSALISKPFPISPVYLPDSSFYDHSLTPSPAALDAQSVPQTERSNSSAREASEQSEPDWMVDYVAKKLATDQDLVKKIEMLSKEAEEAKKAKDKSNNKSLSNVKNNLSVEKTLKQITDFANSNPVLWSEYFSELESKIRLAEKQPEKKASDGKSNNEKKNN